MYDESGGEGLASKKRVGLRWYRGVETGSAGIESNLCFHPVDPSVVD